MRRWHAEAASSRAAAARAGRDGARHFVKNATCRCGVEAELPALTATLRQRGGAQAPSFGPSRALLWTRSVLEQAGLEASGQTSSCCCSLHLDFGPVGWDELP